MASNPSDWPNVELANVSNSIDDLLEALAAKPTDPGDRVHRGLKKNDVLSVEDAKKALERHLWTYFLSPAYQDKFVPNTIDPSGRSTHALYRLEAKCTLLLEKAEQGEKITAKSYGLEEDVRAVIMALDPTHPFLDPNYEGKYQFGHFHFQLWGFALLT